MDRPIGPRQPDIRNAAYEDIFGRPSAVHHQMGQHSQNLYPQQPVQQNYYRGPSPFQQYQEPTSAQFHQRQTARQPFYPVVPSQQPTRPSSQYPQSLAPPSTHSRVRSSSGSTHSPGVIQPQPDEPPDPNPEEFARQGLTPAQAYQAQVYLNDANSNNAYRRDRSPAPNPFQPRPSYTRDSNGDPGFARSHDVPQLGVNLSPDQATLGLDFLEGSSSPIDSEEGDSDLPWVRPRVYIHSYMPESFVDPRISQPEPPLPISVPNRPVSESAVPSGNNRPNPSTFDALSPASPARASLPPPSPSSTLFDQSSLYSPRRSSESSRTTPRRPSRSQGTGDRSMSMSSASAPAHNHTSPRPPIPPALAGAEISPAARSTHHRSRAPVIYPALLSRVAAAFRERMQLNDRVKDDLTYKDCFDGREAVDKIAYIIKTTDRNLALLLGRALDAQKFFHDVTYDHRLRDSPSELYQFRSHVPSPFVSGDLTAGSALDGQQVAPKPPPKDDEPSLRGSASPVMSSAASALTVMTTTTALASPTEPKSAVPQESLTSVPEDETPLPSGVFTILTDCYSPTCSRDQLCYSIACPRRLEQQSRLNLKPQPVLQKQISRESLGDLVELGTLWIHSVPQEIVNSVSDTEKKRQEAINEVIYTERDFVRDMEYLQNSWVNPLKESDIIPAERRIDFLTQVFWNLHEIIAVNTRLRDSLNKRQKSYAVVEQIGDILLDAVPHFGPFVIYGAHQLYGKFQFEDEKRQNPAFAAFVESTERLPESRKLELNGYLTKPTTRLARYPLLMEAVLRHTPDDNPDKETLPKVIALVKEFLAKVNKETGKAENRFNLLQLDQQLVFRAGEQVDLRLQEEGRELIYKGTLTKRGGQGEDLLVYLFDHALLMVKQKSKQDHFKVFRRPIPLELLQIVAPDDFAPTPARTAVGRSQRGLMRRNSLNAAVPPVKHDGKGFSIEFRYLGRKPYQITLWASTYASQRKWAENVQKQQEVMRERSAIFESETLSEGFFVGGNKVNCAAPFAGARKIVYGTDDGVYMSDMRDLKRDPVKVLSLLDVSQVDVLEEYRLLIVLSERQVITFPFEALNPNDPTAGLKRAKKISAHTTFFKTGVCLGRTLVCIVKSSPLSSTIKTLEPIDQHVRGRAKPTYRSLLQGGNDTLKRFREFYIPVESSSIHFLKTKLCVGCSRGFDIVDLETLDTQGLLDPSDESLDFMNKKENLRPMAIYRIANEFLLCYDEFAFYVNNYGWRSRKDFMVYWEGSPTGFGLHYPYVLAFEPTFVEVRHVETGLMSQIIQGSNLRLLFADTPPSMTNTAANMQPNAYGGRPGYVGYGQPPPHVPSGPPSGRDAILMVSNDRVVKLRVTAQFQKALAEGTVR